MKVCLGDIVLLVGFPMECLSAVACYLFDRMLKVKEEKQRNEEVVTYTEGEAENPPSEYKNQIIIGQERRICRLVDDKFRFYNSPRPWE
jgi:hypothetical protein